MAEIVETLTTTGNGTWTVPPYVTSIVVECVGSGGKGGDATNNPSACGGGGGGSYAKKTLDVIPGTVYNTHVGVVTTSGNGDSTWFNTAIYLVAPGGGSAANNGTTGGAGGTGGTGDTTYDGGKGSISKYIAPSTNEWGGGGGSAAWQATGNSATSTQTGAASVGGYSGAGGNGMDNFSIGAGPGGNYGGGGGGGFTETATDSSGGLGAQGIIVITYEPHYVYLIT